MNKNLTPVRNKEEARERGLVGGVKSGEARRKKRELRNLFIQFAEMKPTIKEQKQLLSMGYKEEEITNMVTWVVSVFKNGAKGNSKAMEIGYEILSENEKKYLEEEKLKKDIDRLELENQKLRQLLNIDESSLDNILNNIQSVADLINKPSKNRDIGDFE